jgi:hypothetical protein
LQTYALTAHPAHGPSQVKSIEARIIGLDGEWLRVRWRVEGAQALVIPPFAGKGRADELWQTTCFELFLMPGDGPAYCEFNLSPSERWAAYDFARYREGMAERPATREPQTMIRQGSSFAIFDAALPVDALPAAKCRMNLAAVIEEEGGTKSYWALAHGGDTPDFHDAACFTGTLAAAAKR